MNNKVLEVIGNVHGMSFFVLFFVEMSVGNMGLQGAFPLIKGKNGFP